MFFWRERKKLSLPICKSGPPDGPLFVALGGEERAAEQGPPPRGGFLLSLHHAALKAAPRTCMARLHIKGRLKELGRTLLFA